MGTLTEASTPFIFEHREYDLERQLSRMKDQADSLQSTHDTTQATIFAHSMKFGENHLNILIALLFFSFFLFGC